MPVEVGLGVFGAEKEWDLGVGDREESEYGSLVPTKSPIKCTIDRTTDEYIYIIYTLSASISL